HAAGIAARSVGDFYLVVLKKIALSWIAVFDNFIVLDRIFVAIGADAPYMERKDFGVAVEGDNHDRIVPSLGPQYLDDVTIVFGCVAVRCDRVGRVVEKYDSIGLGWIDGKLLCR